MRSDILLFRLRRTNNPYERSPFKNIFLEIFVMADRQKYREGDSKIFRSKLELSR